MIPLVSLKGTAPFSETMRYGKRFTNGIITAVILFRDYSNENTISSIEIGVSIRKKTAKKAIVRNRIKRLLRVSVRNVMKEFEETGKINERCNFDRMVVFCNSAPKIPSLIKLNDILPDVRSVLSAAMDYNKQRLLRYENNTHSSNSGI